MIHCKVLYQTVIYLIQLVHKKLVKQQYLNDVSNKNRLIKSFLSSFYILATDYLAQLNKEKQQLNNQLEGKKTETICLRVLQKSVYFTLDF